MRYSTNILILGVCTLLASCMANSFDAPDTPAAEVYGNKAITETNVITLEDDIFGLLPGWSGGTTRHSFFLESRSSLL